MRTYLIVFLWYLHRHLTVEHGFAMQDPLIGGLFPMYPWVSQPQTQPTQDGKEYFRFPPLQFPNHSLPKADSQLQMENPVFHPWLVESADEKFSTER